MAFPYVFSATFDDGIGGGTGGQFDSESDTGALMDYPHYTTLARQAGIGPAVPYRGAYCMRVVMGDTNDHTVQANPVNISLNNLANIAFAMYIQPNFVTGGTTDIFNILEAQSTSNAVEACVSLQVVTSSNAEDQINIGIGETEASAFTAGVITTGQWHVIELILNIDQGTQDDGTVDLLVDGVRTATQIASLNQLAITHAVLGTQNSLAATVGTILFDEMINDDLRLIYPPRWATTRLVSATETILFVGPGTLDDLYIRDGSNGDVVVEVFDTDIYLGNLLTPMPLFQGRTVVANTDVQHALAAPIRFERGCLITLTGTTPGAIVTFTPKIWGPGAIRNYGRTRPSTFVGNYR